MKKSIPPMVFGLLGILACFLYQTTWAQTKWVLPDYDKRLAAPMVQDLSVVTDREAAAGSLRARVTNAVVNIDRLHGSPRMVINRRGFLTGPAGHDGAIPEEILSRFPETDPHKIIRAFIDTYQSMFGHDASVLSNAVLIRYHTMPNSGLKLTLWQQTVDGIPVFQGVLAGALSSNDELVSLSSLFIGDPENAANRGMPTRKSREPVPTIDPAQALQLAALNVGVTIAPDELTILYHSDNAEQKHIYKSLKLTQEACVRLRWFPLTPKILRLCWEVTLWPTNTPGKYLILVDAETGEVMLRRCLTRWQKPVTFNVFTNDSPTPFSPGWSEPILDQPQAVSRSLVTVTNFSPTGSPMGWVDDDGQFPTTSGNNAIARAPGIGTVIGTNRVFNFPLDLSQEPSNYVHASVVQLFYDANWYHDVLYELGFTESLGNYQKRNFRRGGFEGDPLICVAQDETNNAYFIPAEDGESGICIMGIFTGPKPDRDSALDQEVVFHELTHGVSLRVVGGGLALTYSQPRGMGEGWSDFFPIRILSQPTDNPDGCYAYGGYSSYMLFGLNFPNYYFGIRRYPYSADLKKNPLTFRDIDPTQANPHLDVPINPLFAGGDPEEEHNQGEFWGVVLHEVWAALVKTYGWYQGNQMAMQLVFLGMTLTPPEPTYTEARDAILLADQVLTGGANYALLWQAFAKRGLGYRASCPPPYTTRGVRESFDLPPDVTSMIPDDVLEVRVTPETGAALIAGSDEQIYVHVTDGTPVTNAKVTGDFLGAPIEFRNDGQEPDVWASDNIYTASIRIPMTPTNLIVKVIAEAPNKIAATTTVEYLVIPRPTNDNFTNAIKVMGDGFFLSNNKLATLEKGEPCHADIKSVQGSLWWNFIPPLSGQYLIDAGGSEKRTVLAVYTNSYLTNLAPVASAVGSAVRKGPYLVLNARTGTVYQVVLAGYDPNSLGSVQLKFVYQGIPDTNAPIVSITSPISGSVVDKKYINVAGTATDSGANPSGVKRIYVVSTPTAGPGVTNQIIPPSYEWTGPTTTNWNLTVGLQPGLNKIIVWAEDFAGNQSAKVPIEITYKYIDPPNDFFATALWLTNQTETNIVRTANATKELNEPNHAGISGGKSVWFAFRAPADGLFDISTEGSDFDTVLAVYQGDSITNLSELASNDDETDSSTSRHSRICLGVKSNQVYHIALDGYAGLFGRAILIHRFTPMPVVNIYASNSLGGCATAKLGTTSLRFPLCLPIGKTITLKSVPNTEFHFDHWKIGGVIYLSDPLPLTVVEDTIVVPVFQPTYYIDGFEGGFAPLGWITNGTNVGAAPWFTQTNVVKSGAWAARSGPISHNQHSSLILTAKFREGLISFWYKVSSEPGFDKLTFLVDGVPVMTASGEVDWTRFVYNLTAGVHTLEWRYSKDAAHSGGLDAAFIDNLDLPFELPTNQSTPARLYLGWSGEKIFYLEVAGQAGQRYIIQRSDDLQTWVNISTNVLGTGPIRLVVPEPTSSMQFYRAIVHVGE